MTGKEKCRLLRQIRNQVARKNGLAPFEDTCTHKGECAGTCPKCEAEVKALSQALENRRARRKRVALAGVSLGVCATLAGCSLDDAIDSLVIAKNLVARTAVERTEVELDGDIAMPVDIEELTGEVNDTDIEVEMGEMDMSDNEELE